MASKYGQGSIHRDEAKGLWVAAIELPRDPDGRRRRKFIRGKTKAVVLAKMREAQSIRDKGGTIANEIETTGQWLEHWRDNIIPTMSLADKTAHDYAWQVSKHLIPRLGKIKLAKLRAEHVERMMMNMADEGLAPRSIALARTVLRMALGVAEQRGRIAHNVAALTRAPRKTATRLDDALDASEASAVINAASGDRLEALAVMVLATGLRQGEALRLRWSDVDLDARTLTVRKSKTRSGERTIAIPAMVATALDHHRRQQAKERLAASVWADDDLIFASTVGTMIDARNALRWWHDLCDRAGVGRRRFHATRHTAATLMLNNGVPLEVVSATLGHAGLAITADVYAKVRPELQRTAATAMDAVLGGNG